MVFEKASQFVLVVQTGVEVLAHGACMAITKAVVQPLVIGEAEAELLAYLIGAEALDDAAKQAVRDKLSKYCGDDYELPPAV